MIYMRRTEKESRYDHKSLTHASDVDFWVQLLTKTLRFILSRERYIPKGFLFFRLTLEAGSTDVCHIMMEPVLSAENMLPPKHTQQEIEVELMTTTNTTKFVYTWYT